jgi:hypothetical protein
MNKFLSRISGIKFNSIIDNLNYLFILILLIGFSLNGKEFAKQGLNFTGIPLYITEIVIFFVIILLYLKAINNNGRLLLEMPLKLEFAFFYFIFFISLFTGLFFYPDAVYTLRQSALFYYSIFYFLAFLIFNEISSLLKIKIIFLLFFTTVNLIAIYLFFNRFYINLLELIGFRYIGIAGERYFYISLLLIIEIVYLVYLRRSVFTVVLIASISILFFITIAYGVRSNWVSIFIAIIFIWIFLGVIPGLKRELRNFIFLILSFTGIAVVVGILIYFKIIEIPSDLYKSLKGEFLSLFNIYIRANTTPTVNTGWRMITWNEMFNEIKSSPVFGFGLGKKFISTQTLILGWTTGLMEGWVEAHNVFLSFLYRSGFLGLGAFLIIIFSFFIRIFKFLRRCLDEKIKIIIIALVCCIIYILISSLFGVVLEVPYFGVFMWVFMGMVMALITYYEKKYPYNDIEMEPKQKQ